MSYLKLFVVVAISQTLLTAQAARAENDTIKWIGVVKEEAGQHTTDHNHEIQFVRQSDQETFDVVDSPELEKLHHGKEKRLLVEAVGRVTPKFLFWGGNLVVSQFNVLKELESIPHQKPVVRRHERMMNNLDRQR